MLPTGGGGANGASHDGPTLSELAARLDALHADVQALKRTEIERYFDLPSTADLLGVSYQSLRTILMQQRARLSPAVYRWDKRHLRHRMLSASDVRILQSLRIRPRLPLSSRVA